MTTGNEPSVPAEPPEDGPHAGTPSTLEGNHRLRTGKGLFERSPESVARDAEAADLRAQGWTLQRIADHLGYTDRSNARVGIIRAKADVARPAVTRLIQTESAELDELYAEALAILQRNHVTVSHGKVITWRNPDTGNEEPLQDDGPKLQAIQLALRVRESYRKLHGLDQPAQVAVSGAVRYEVVGVDPADLT